ncbi:MAG: hypothetical protein IPH88_06420 [Bacteroidales bacterium]|nr:hypothetical protein [Bacteroidales bacterium]
MKNIVLASCLMLLSFLAYAQTPSKIQKLIPAGVVDPAEIIQPMAPFMVRVEYTGKITETATCSKGTLGDIKVAISWYNTNDETGKMMVGMVSPASELQKHWQKDKEEITEIYQQYKNGGYGENMRISEVKTEDVPAGKLTIFDVSNPCVESDIPKSQRVFARCFIFNGTTQCEIRIEAQCSPDEIRTMIKTILNETSSFNFSGLM